MDDDDDDQPAMEETSLEGEEEMIEFITAWVRRMNRKCGNQMTWAPGLGTDMREV